ncbi:MAG: hypothetical protein L3K23_10445 [Thermoplasmata archaeon]|nr:hypothetical protein [Thermoplasmata archaeon]
MDSHPPERWSAGMLIDEVKRLRAEGTGSVDDRVRQVSDKYERARGDVERLSKELAAARGLRPTGIAGERVAGKRALSEFRQTWREFTDAVVNLPEIRAAYGMDGVRLVVATDLIPDLYLLGLTAPRGSIDARERDRLRRILDSPSLVAIMARPEAWADRMRTLFLSQAARSFFRASVWAVYEHASDEGRIDRYGTVVK